MSRFQSIFLFFFELRLLRFHLVELLRVHSPEIYAIWCFRSFCLLLQHSSSILSWVSLPLPFICNRADLEMFRYLQNLDAVRGRSYIRHFLAFLLYFPSLIGENDVYDQFLPNPPGSNLQLHLRLLRSFVLLEILFVYSFDWRASFPLNYATIDIVVFPSCVLTSPS